MNKVKKRFIFYAMAAVFVLLTLMLGTINVINFSMAADDADIVTQMIARENGAFRPDEFTPVGDGKSVRNAPGDGFDRMGPGSPEIHYTTRYFTFKFDADGNAEKVAFNISAFSEEEALETARGLLGKKTGWTDMTYRYRVYKNDGTTYVTVIDQGRELLPSFRILVFSIIGEICGLIISLIFLCFVGKKLFRPLEEADRKQQRFIAEAEAEFKVPLTIINADAELIERENGQSEHTASIRRQVGKMTSLVKDIGRLAIYDGTSDNDTVCDISGALSLAIDRRADSFAEKGITLERRIEDGLTAEGNADTLERAFAELVDNSLKFAVGRATMELKNENGRTVIVFRNDTSLADGNYDQAFDRFTRLENSSGISGSGLGLSLVKEAVKAQNGRLSAYVRDGEFIVRIVI